MKQPLIYHDKPLFGLDIGFSNLKVMQIATGKDKIVRGYGVTNFNPKAIHEGVIVDVEEVAKAAHRLFTSELKGSINTRRVAVSLPAMRAFTRNLSLPKLNRKDLGDAIISEAEQYIPVPADELYLDYTITSESADTMELLMVAAPKRIVDSYLDLLRVLDLEPVVLETTINASGRLFVHSEKSSLPTIIIDFGSISSDITAYEKTMVVTGTVLGGGDSFTNTISEKLGVGRDEANIIKTKYGLGLSKKQSEINEALLPVLKDIVKEVQRVVRYYEDRSVEKRRISQIVTLGGGANMLGLGDYLTNQLRLPVRTASPWNNLKFGKLAIPNETEKTLYATVAGLALISPKEAFQHD